jgi:hypothetical protein
LATSTSRPPNALPTAASARRSDAGAVTSPATASVPARPRGSDASVARRFARVRPSTATRAPLAASTRAIPAPIPEPPPVTRQRNGRWRRRATVIGRPRAR